MTTNVPILFSCEHAGNRVPVRWIYLFKENPEILQSHRAYDIGIRSFVRKLARQMKCPLQEYSMTRLLIDTNRFAAKNLYSEFSVVLPQEEKQHLFTQYYTPYRNEIIQSLTELMNAGYPVLHLSLHSFTPIWNGKKRTADIGILYDPTRKREKAFVVKLQKLLKEPTGLRVRRNYPYLGISDGMTSSLRKNWLQNKYLGIEIELNQHLLLNTTSTQYKKLLTSFQESLNALVKNRI